MPPDPALADIANVIDSARRLEAELDELHAGVTAPRFRR